MEFQFSVPVNDAPASSKVKKDRVTSALSAAAPKPGPVSGAKGGTFRFALESRTRHTRRSSTRARTGCSTCKKRHVKCDETKPACLNCLKWRGYCDSYGIGGQDDPSSAKRKSPLSKRSRSEDGVLIHTKKAPVLLTEPDINTIRFASGDQRLYFDAWTSMSISYLSGGLVQTRLWTATMPQVSLEESTLRFAAMAVGALRTALQDSPVEALNTSNRHYLNAIVYYCEAMKLQSAAVVSRSSLRTALLASLLFICFETQRGNLHAALKHIVHGFGMLNELAACSATAPDLVSMAQSPPIMVQEILDCYKPLELQSRSFMGSYNKFFFAQKQKQAQAAAASRLPPSGPSPPATTSSPSESSQAGSQWQRPAVSTTLSPTGLPSPESSSQSPQSDSAIPAAGQTPSPVAQLTATPGPPSGPQRPPHIAPFTKHSPYFRPKQVDITRLEDMPLALTTYDEARGYWTLLQKRMVLSLPLLTSFTAQLGLTRAKSDSELDEKLASVKKHPKISAFVADSRLWLQRWSEAFLGYFHECKANKHRDLLTYLHAADIWIEYLILYIYTTLPRFSGLITAKGLTPQYRELILYADELLSARPHCGFAMDSGWSWPLFVAAFGCRDVSVREAAIRVLEKYPIRNALRDSRVFRAIAVRNQETEYLTTLEGTEHEQWLRLRRREVVFEDFGQHIIYRSAQKDDTGEWNLVEEIADFHVNEDGTLNWTRQPISDAASIMSGVC